MRKITIGFILVLNFLFLYSCDSEQENTTNKEMTSEDIDNFKQEGDSIASYAQSVLMQNVQNAIQEGGLEYAVSFCNENAIEITNNISDKHTIQRLTDKNRNPKNVLDTEMDKKAWKEIKAAFEAEDFQNMEYLEESEEGVYYYKGITLAMPTCVKCHGKENEDIDAAVLAKIQEKYPEDLATGYEEGAFRGIWKLKLK